MSNETKAKLALKNQALDLWRRRSRPTFRTELENAFLKIEEDANLKWVDLVSHLERLLRSGFGYALSIEEKALLNRARAALDDYHASKN